MNYMYVYIHVNTWTWTQSSQCLGKKNPIANKLLVVKQTPYKSSAQGVHSIVKMNTTWDRRL